MTPQERLDFGKEISAAQHDLQKLCRDKIFDLSEYILDEEKLEVGTLVYLNSVLAPLFYPILRAPPELRKAMAEMLVRDIRKAALNCFDNVTK
jgi:hypothetical protein